MNILLIDDDDYIVEAVKAMINWEKIGIEGVFTSNNTEQARQIVEWIPIDIMLCDIEMGSESGLDFVEKIRSRGNEAKVIFLTSYAEFSYAHRAISLRSTDYILKPVKFQVLEELLEKTVEEIHQQSDWLKNKEQWMQSAGVRREGFWRKILEDRVEKGTWSGEQKVFGLNYSEEQKFLYMQMTVLDYKLIYEKLESGMLDFFVQEIMESVFSGEEHSVETVFRVEGEDISRWDIVLKIPQSGIKRNEMELLGKQCIQKFKDFTGSKACLYIGIPVLPDETAVCAREVLRMAQDSIYADRLPLFLEDYEYKDMPYVEPSFPEWESMLLEGKVKSMLEELEQYMQKLQFGKNCNSRVLKSFLTDFHQMLYVVLRKRNISMSRLLQEEEKEEVNKATHSIAYMKEYAKAQVEKVVSGIEFVSKKQSVVENVKKYMEEHLGEELTRDDFAAQVFLNGDYLARLFKKETGMSIGQYLVKMRMQKAKQLLYETKMPVHEIAAEVGYTNFSYFAKLFGKAEGMKPNEYRKKYRKE